MKKILLAVLALGLVLGLGTSAQAECVTLTDVINSGYSFGKVLNQDWDWYHNPLCPGPTGYISCASLTINATDVNLIGTNPPQEIDNIYAWDAAGSSWVLLGNLVGSSGATTDTTFNLTGLPQLFDDIKAGLQIRIDIDALDRGWTVTINSSTLKVDCCPVPVPGAMLLLGSGLLCLAAHRRRKLASST